MPKLQQYVKPGKENLIISNKKRVPKSAEDVMAGMKGGDERIGSNYTIKSAPKPAVDNLDAEGIAQKRAMRDLLISAIVPNSLSSKSSPEQDKRSLVGKFNKCTLKELKGFIPDRIKRMSVEKLKGILDGTEEITDEEKVEIQDLYMGISP